MPLGSIPSAGGTVWGTVEFTKRHISMLNEGSFGSSVVIGEDRFVTWSVEQPRNPTQTIVCYIVGICFVIILQIVANYLHFISVPSIWHSS